MAVQYMTPYTCTIIRVNAYNLTQPVTGAVFCWR